MVEGMSDLYEYVQAAEVLAGLVEDHIYLAKEVESDDWLLAWTAYIVAYGKLFTAASQEDHFTLRPS